MTAEGGIFNEQMVKQSETMSGLASTVKDNVFLAFAELGEQIEETFKIKDEMRAFIGWLQNLTGALKKPREEQEGFARAVSETLRGMGAVKDFLTPEPGGDARANAYAKARGELGNFAPPSLFAPSAAAGAFSVLRPGARAGARRRSRWTSSNMPRGTRTEIRNLGTNLDVNTGFAMQAAM